ncbi:MAG TPA: hypothetical protein VGC97_03765 [Pyrinomonadaceae bacterium]|jgi:hypothetical protein
MKIRFLQNLTSKAILLPVALLFFSQLVQAQNTAFTFQGKLNENGAPAHGLYDLQFRLYDLPAGGTLFGTIVRDDVPVTDGIFTVTLDYGADVFYSNSGRYLGVGVRAGAGTGAFTTINPRQELTASPYSLQALRASKAGDAENFGGQAPSAYLRSNVSQIFTGGNLTVSPSSILDVQGALFGSGANLTSLNASNISNGTLADARLSANVARRNEENIFTQFVQFNVPPVASGEFIGNLGANNIATGTLSDARLSANIPRLNAGNTFSAANNNFAGRVSANTLSVGGGLPVTKVLTASATLDFGKSTIFQEVLNITVLGARVGDAVYLGIPANVLPVQNYVPPGGGTPVPITQPYVFQAYVSAADTVSVTWDRLLASDGNTSGAVGRSACAEGIDFYECQPPAGVFRVVVFSFAP